ncbi:MAG: LamG-like jellyroll fold domain-containing protein [Candidatus Paceibacterota bacterium]
MNKIIKKQLAFTLIELLVVIAIIGILSALIVVGMNSTTQKANVAKSQVFANSLRNSLMSNIVAQYSFDDINASDYDPTTKVMNNDAGNVPDSWLDNEGRAYNGPIVKDGADCVSGKCLSFDANDDYVSCGNIGIPINGTATLEGWFYANSKATDSGHFNYFFYGDSTDNLFYIHSANNYIYTAGWEYVPYDFPIKKWNHLVLTYSGDSSTAKLYVNGIKYSFTIQSGASNMPSLTIFGIAKATVSFDGMIDEIRVYNAIVPTSQIQQNYFTGLNKLFAKNQITQTDYQQRLTELSSDYAKQ